MAWGLFTHDGRLDSPSWNFSVMKMTSNKFFPCEEDISPKYLLAEMGGILYKVDQRRKKGSKILEEILCSVFLFNILWKSQYECKEPVGPQWKEVLFRIRILVLFLHSVLFSLVRCSVVIRFAYIHISDITFWNASSWLLSVMNLSL